MSRKMLIDAAHPEETRVVVLDGSRVEEFDFESQSRKQLRGNIYLAKVTRVEPSLQAAFVDFGGNRHGFLAFNEIHPDYYQIPHADREALIREAAEGDDDESGNGSATNKADEEADGVGLEDELEVDEEIERRRRRILRRYKIQEVIRRRQIMLVQVVKEERGNKGAALTTYLSLAGRYCVLMPNTDRGGGISRKINSATDRKRLRSVVQSLEVPPGMGLIVRTAGAKRTKAEIKRDYDYLVRAWDNIRETTLHSIAPALIYEEEDLVKRAIRDLYDKDIEDIWVEGEAGYKEARDFMRMLMPAQAKKVQAYREPVPLFVRHRIEDHLSQIYSPVVPLRSGGYLVINQTEALVAIDVNSGRSTRERNIEATALKTNLEAAEEATRQLRLRDLAGLIVIDFIDMEEAKNNRAVEKKLKDCLKDDRARVQAGKISAFGLMELSRQRRRTGILEGTTHVCPHCQGAGRVRSVESSAITALRAVELEGLRGGGEIVLRVPREIGLYILNAKRDHLVRLRQTHGLSVNVALDDALAAAEHAIDRLTSEAPPATARAGQAPEPSAAEEDVDEALEVEVIEDDDAEAELELAEEAETARHPSGEDGERRGRRRRRRRGRRPEEEQTPPSALAPRPEPGLQDQEDGRRRRRRGRRGGRRGRDEGRPADVYAWAWPARLAGDDPYQWRGPSQLTSGRIESSEPKPQATMSRVEALEAAEPDDSALEVWVELAPQAEPEGRVRRPRRGRRPPGVEPRGDRTESVLAEEHAPPEVAPPEPTAALEAPASVLEEPGAAAAEPSPESAPEPKAPPPYEADEIISPPAAPRRGWWRQRA